MRLETFGQSSESDNTKKGKDIIRRKAEELLNIGSRQSDDKSTSSTANDQFLAEITKGAIDSLERRGFFEKTGMQRLFGRKLTENRLPDDLMSKAKEHIKSIIKGVARNPQMLTQQQKDFISSFLAVDVYSNKAKSLSIHRNLEKFAKGLRDASAAFIAHSEVQDNLLGITKDSSGKITVDLEALKVPLLDLSKLNLSGVGLWKIGEINWNTYYQQQAIYGTSVRMGEEVLHRAQCLGIVAENSDLCKQVLKTYLDLKRYLEQGYQDSINPHETSTQLESFSEELSKRNKAVLESYVSGGGEYISKEEKKEYYNKLVNVIRRHKSALLQEEHDIEEKEMEIIREHSKKARNLLDLAAKLKERLEGSSSGQEFIKELGASIVSYEEDYKIAQEDCWLVVRLSGASKTSCDINKLMIGVRRNFENFKTKEQALSVAWNGWEKDERAIEVKEEVGDPEHKTNIKHERAVRNLYVSIWSDENKRPNDDRFRNTYTIAEKMDGNGLEDLKKLREVNNIFREFLKQAPIMLRSRLNGLVKTGREILGEAKEHLGNKYVMSGLSKGEKEKFDGGIASLESYQPDTVQRLLESDPPDLDGMVKAFEELARGRSRLNRIIERLREIEGPRALFSDDPTKKDFAIEKVVMDRYLSVYREQEQKNIESFAKHLGVENFVEYYALAKEIDSGKQPGSLDTIRKINTTFREAAEKSPEQFRKSLRKEGETARTLDEWASSFTERLDLGESWVKTAMEKKLGVTKDNFEKSNEKLRKLLDHPRLGQFLNSPTAVSDIVSGDSNSNRQAYEANCIVQDCEELIRAIEGFKYIHSLLKDGIPVDAIPEQIKGRKVIEVSGVGNDCLPRSLLTGAHPDWSPELIEEYVGEAKRHVVKEYGKKAKRYQEEVKEHEKQMQKLRKQGKEASLSGVEYQLAQEEIYDTENLNVTKWDQLNLGGDAGQILTDYLRSTQVDVPSTGDKVSILEPDRAILGYEYRDRKIRCFELAPGNSNNPPYAVLRDYFDETSGHYYAIQNKPSE